MFLFFNGDMASMFLFYSYLKSALSTVRELIFTRELFSARKSLNHFFFFARNNFRKKTYFTYFARIKFNELYKKDTLPVAVTFCRRLKKAFTIQKRLSRDLNSKIQIFKIFTGIKFPEFRELAVY